MFDLAWNARGGLVVNLKDVPDYILNQMIDWARDYIDQGNTREI
jgi:hypothetical protein